MGSIALFGFGCLTNEQLDFRVNFFLFFAPTRLNVFRIKDYVDDTSRFGQRNDHLVS